MNLGFPVHSVHQESAAMQEIACSTGGLGSILQSGRYPEEGNAYPLQYSCLENSMGSMKKQKDMTPEDELPRSKCVQYATREEWRAIINSFRKNETAGPSRNDTVVDVSGGESPIL